MRMYVRVLQAVHTAIQQYSNTEVVCGEEVYVYIISGGFECEYENRDFLFLLSHVQKTNIPEMANTNPQRVANRLGPNTVRMYGYRLENRKGLWSDIRVNVTFIMKFKVQSSKYKIELE